MDSICNSTQIIDKVKIISNKNSQIFVGITILAIVYYPQKQRLGRGWVEKGPKSIIAYFFRLLLSYTHTHTHTHAQNLSYLGLQITTVMAVAKVPPCY